MDSIRVSNPSHVAPYNVLGYTASLPSSKASREPCEPEDADFVIEKSEDTQSEDAEPEGVKDTSESESEDAKPL